MIPGAGNISAGSRHELLVHRPLAVLVRTLYEHVEEVFARVEFLEDLHHEDEHADQIEVSEFLIYFPLFFFIDLGNLVEKKKLDRVRHEQQEPSPKKLCNHE